MLLEQKISGSVERSMISGTAEIRLCLQISIILSRERRKENEKNIIPHDLRGPRDKFRWPCAIPSVEYKPENRPRTETV